MIEIGRYKKPSKIPREQRLCPVCGKGVGDEYHLLFLCDNVKLVDIRTEFLNKINSITPQIHKLNSVQQFQYIISCVDASILQDTASFVYGCLKTYYEITE